MERNGTEWNITDIFAGTERNEFQQNGMERNGTNRIENLMKRNGTERIGFDKLRISFIPFRSGIKKCCRPLLTRTSADEDRAEHQKRYQPASEKRQFSLAFG